MKDDLRIGFGFDVHPLVVGRPLKLGSVTIPFEKGLEGHSDADVLLHAVTDAVLGALCWGDIGTWFPNTEAEFKNKNSDFFLQTVWTKAIAAGWCLSNCDCMLLAERPKLQPYISAMRENFSRIFRCEMDRISVKVTTTEKLGFVGREEGMAAKAVVLLRQMSQ